MKKVISMNFNVGISNEGEGISPALRDKLEMDFKTFLQGIHEKCGVDTYIESDSFFKEMDETDELVVKLSKTAEEYSEKHWGETVDVWHTESGWIGYEVYFEDSKGLKFSVNEKTFQVKEVDRCLT